ncbi:MAG: tyrosine-protein phosphatase [Acidobacteriota bacterium]
MQVSCFRQQSLHYTCQLSKSTLLTLIILLSSTYVTAASEPPVAEVTIYNFGQVDDRLYRGGQPKPDEYRQLAALGIKTIVDLRNDPEKYESSAAEAAGLRYIHIPMSAKHPPTDGQVEEFLKTIDEPVNGKVFVHCAGGRHRTGVMVAAYRFEFYQWNSQQAYDEMKAYDFYTRWGHGAMKDYVFNYSKKPVTTTSASPNSTSVIVETAQQH